MMVKKLVLITFSWIASVAYGQNNREFCAQLSALNQRIEQFHYNPKTLNDSLSKNVLHLFLDRLDADHRFFQQSDIALFQNDAFKLDDAVSLEDCGFIDKYSKTLQHRIEQSKTCIESLRDSTFDYSGTDTLFFRPGSRAYLKDDSALKTYWNKRLRYLILDDIVEKDSTLIYLEENFRSLESDVKPKIIQNQLCLLDELLHKNGGLDTYVKESFLNALANYQDPNSSFFNDSDKAVFEGTVSNHHLTFGIETVKNKDGDIIISYIAPGSSAFINGNFDQNDVIKSLTSTAQTLETICVSNDDILAFTSNEKNDTVIFKIKKQNGSVQEVQLTKTELKIKENSCRSFVIDAQSNFGYIEIPSFYTDLDSPNGNGLTYDVAYELQKLNNENIKGLILDLRFNGGGSMKEAAQLSGLFINKGPLAILKYKNGALATLKDQFKGTLFNKPVIILINSYSASASEFFVAAMQDYNRAIIMGSKSHGKATAQIIIPLSEHSDLGFCKLTIEKFYRVTGKSHQSIGILPDIAMPSFYDGFTTNESFSPFAFSNDQITPTIKPKFYRKFPMAELNSKSQFRMANNASFKAIKSINNTLINDYTSRDTEYALTLKNVYDDTKTYNQYWSNFNTIIDSSTEQLLLRNTMSPSNTIAISSEELELAERLSASIATDIYIQEALAVLIDVNNIR